MHRYFSVMAGFLTVFLGIVVFLGFRANLGTANTHISSGFFLVVALLFVHSLVCFYLIGSGRAIREAIVERPWAKPYLARINEFRIKTFPVALLSISFSIIAAWIGAAAHTGVVTTMTHRATSLAVVAFNLLTFFVEYTQLRRNSVMIAGLQDLLEKEYQEALAAGKKPEEEPV